MKAAAAKRQSPPPKKKPARRPAEVVEGIAHNMLGGPVANLERLTGLTHRALWREFWADADEVGECWVYQGDPLVSVGGKVLVPARYVAWALYDYRLVPLGRPTCGNAKCIRPEHQTGVARG